MDETPGGRMQAAMNMPLSFWFRCGRRDRQRGQHFEAGSTRRSARLAYALGWWFDAVWRR